MTNTTISDIVRYADKTARERNVKWMDTTILLKSLLWSASEAYRILQRGGLGYSEDNPDYLARFDRELVRFDNEPLEEGEKPRFTPVALRLVAGQEESSTEAEDKSSDTAIFTVQVEKEFGVRNLSCPAKVMDATSDLPDAGTYRCTVSDGKDDSTVRDVRLIVTADNKVGLYDADGKALK